MTDATSPEMAAYFRRYDNRNRLLFAATLCACLMLSVVNLSHGVQGGPDGKGAGLAWAMAIVFAPLFILVWWIIQELIARWRKGLPATGEDDARNGLRVANAGFLYNIGLMAVGLGTQASVTLVSFGYLGGDWISRGTMVVMGVALVCLGNVWPNRPPPRGSLQTEAKVMRINRAWGWIMVLSGLGLIIWGLFVPLLYPALRNLNP
jgi:hypothetical protein